MRLNSTALLDMVTLHQTYNYQGATPSFRELAKEMGIPPSTFTRLRHKKSLSADALLRIVEWLRLKKGHDADILLMKITASDKPKRSTRRTA